MKASDYPLNSTFNHKCICVFFHWDYNSNVSINFHRCSLAFL